VGDARTGRGAGAVLAAALSRRLKASGRDLNEEGYRLATGPM
jgi:hypothetical protein